MERYWPLQKGRIVTSPFGPREGEFHTGVDFGFPNGSAGKAVYAIQSGTVIYAGAAQGYGGPDPAGWLVIDSDDAEGGGCVEYGHIVRLPGIKVGTHVEAGQQIAIINPSSASNGGTAPHLHVSDMPGAYDPSQKQNVIPRLKSALEPGATVTTTVAKTTATKPDFNEYTNFSNNCQSRNKTKIDLFLIHTQEGPGNADSLARFLRSTENGSNPVSYHYTISEDPGDHGVTVVDVVDTDLASYSVANSNNRAINLCFAGSRAGWTRQQWLQQSRAIDCAAYLAVADCRKYQIPIRVLAPPYSQPPPGISDHRYCSKFLRDGNDHQDVGDNFPWDVFAAAVKKYANQAPAPAPVPAPQIDLLSPTVLSALAGQFL
jgi:hypothetical protein